LNDKKANKYLQKATVLRCCFLFLMISLCSNAASRRALAAREKQLITVFRDAPEQNKKLKITTLVADAYRIRIAVCKRLLSTLKICIAVVNKTPDEKSPNLFSKKCWTSSLFCGMLPG